MTKPLIGVTVSEIRRSEDAQRVAHGEPLQTEMTLGLAYMRAVERAGGLPVALSPLAAARVEPLLEHLGGLLLSGGPDLHPQAYGAGEHAHLGPTDREVDAFELALCRNADARGMPILGICRGAQLLNVARGGTLHQHLPEVNHDAVEHRQVEPGDRSTHEVRVAPDSALAQTTGPGPLQVNSFHHQAIEMLGEGLRAVAWSPDGLIEAIEDVDRAWVLGVQWHAETLASSEHQALFEALVQAAHARAASGTHESAGARAG